MNFHRSAQLQASRGLGARVGRGTVVKPAAANRKQAAAGKSLPAAKAPRGESVALSRALSGRLDQPKDSPKRKLRKPDRFAGRAESERRSGTATLRAFRKERTCRRCGCTQYNACEDDRLMDSCSWVELDICSACLSAPEFKRFLAGHRKPSLGP